MKKKWLNRLACLSLALVLALSGLLSENLAVRAVAAETAGTEQGELEVKKEALRKLLTQFGEVINQFYIEDVDIPVLVEKTLKQVTMETSTTDAIKLLYQNIGDPYTCYYTSEEYRNMMDSTTGNYVGIGASVQQDRETMEITIVKPFQNGPAAKAGMLAGDKVIAVDGTNVTKLELEQVVSMMKGEAGTKVVITVLRGSRKVKLTITRNQVQDETVTWSMLKDKVGYIKITQFEEVTVAQFDTALAKLKKKGMKKLIIDLRNNPGGLLSTATELLDRLLPKNKLLVYTEDKFGNKDEKYSKTEAASSVPLAVLVNGSSASSSEVFCGAVRDYGIGTLIGTKTYGKGIVQSILPFMDGAAMKITVSKYYSPKGHNIHGTGFVPDIEVEFSSRYGSVEDTPMSKDTQLMAAKKFLKNQ